MGTKSSQKQQGPVIALTSAASERTAYAQAVTRGGGEPLVVTEATDMSTFQVQEAASGLLLCDGASLDSDETGDGLEVSLLEAALRTDMPVLCVGRGMQLLNVVMGGGVVHDIAGHAADEQGASGYHRIYISPGSKLAAVVGSGGLVRVNSRHSSGLRDAQRAPALMASAYSLDDGYVEALESPDHRWVLGVQFQPERRGEIPPHFDRLFESLVDRAGERMFPVEV